MRRDEVWQSRGGTYIETTNPSGYDILVNGSNKYINFNTLSGSTGYGIRDNSGTMEFKNSGGSWTAFGSGGGSSVWGSITGTITNQTDLTTYLSTNYVPYTGASSNINVNTRSITFEYGTPGDGASIKGSTDSGVGGLQFNSSPADTDGTFQFKNVNTGFSAFLYANTTADRFVTFPDSDGVLATQTYVGTVASLRVPYSGWTGDVNAGSTYGITFGNVAASENSLIIADDANDALLIFAPQNAANGRIGLCNYNTGYRAYMQTTNLSATREIELPNANGTLVLSVNGTTPNAAGDVTVSAGANTSLSNLASVAINTTLLPASNDGAGLGSGTLAFSDLFLAAGAVININNGNVTITHTAGKLTFNNTAIALGSGAITTTGNITGNSYLGSGLMQLGSTNNIRWGNGVRSQISSPADGDLLMQNAGATGFTALKLGGTTSSFPAIKRSSATLAFRLADDSADAAITAAGATLSGTLALGANNITMTGSIASTGSRVTKGWFTDLEVTNAPTLNGVAIPSISSTNTLTNKRITKRTGTTTSSATPTINTDNVDFYSITALAAAITSFTTNLSGTPTEAQTLWIAITDDGTPRAITWGASFEASTVALPTTTVASTRMDVGFVWNTVTSKWRCVAVA